MQSAVDNENSGFSILVSDAVGPSGDFPNPLQEAAGPSGDFANPPLEAAGPSGAFVATPPQEAAGPSDALAISLPEMAGTTSGGLANPPLEAAGPSGAEKATNENRCVPYVLRLCRKQCRMGLASNNVHRQEVVGVAGAAKWDIESAFTLRGRELAECIFRGFKDAENRNFRMRPGWYAIHVGRGKIAGDMDKLLRDLVSGLPLAARDGPEVGAIVGVCYVARAVHLAELRAESNCGSDCFIESGKLGAIHAGSCRLSLFCHGPVCNLITKAIRIPTPVPCKGNLGLWRVSEEVRQQVNTQLENISASPADTKALCN